MSYPECANTVSADHTVRSRACRAPESDHLVGPGVAAPAVAVQGLARRALAAACILGHAEVLIGVAARELALLLVFDALVLLVPLPVALGTGKARIALAEVGVGNVAIDLVVLQVLEIGLAVQPGVGSHPDPLQDILIASQRFEALAHALEHRRKQVVLLALPERLAVHHDLVSGIDHRHAVVPQGDFRWA